MSKYRFVIIIFLVVVFIALAWKARDVDFHKSLRPAISLDQHSF